MSIFVNISSNFLHAIFIPQATIGTKNPGNSTTNTAKITPFFYKRGNKIVKFHSMNWSIERWIVERSCGHFDAKNDFMVPIVFKKT